MIGDQAGQFIWLSYLGTLSNIGMLFSTILKNPGIPQEYLDRFLKEQHSAGKAPEGVQCDSDSAEEDIEKGSVTKRQHRPSESEQPTGGPKQNYCSECKIYRLETTEHCEDCKVCIQGYDHHCIFFSKCIGGGNIFQFWSTIAGLGINFVIVIALMVVAGIASDPSTRRGGHHKLL